MEQIEGIILSVSHYKDNDAILNILTADGMYVVLGRGIFNSKKPLRIFTTPFIRAYFEIYKGKVGGFKLKDAKVIRFYNEDYLNFNMLSSLNFLSELTLKTIDGIDNFGKLYSLLVNTLDAINKNFSLIYLTDYFLKLLKLLGLKILITDYNDQFFSPNEGRFIKDENDSTIYFNLDEIIYLDDISNDKNIEFTTDEVDFKKILNTLTIFLANCTDVQLKSIEIL